jgi:protein gp37
MSHISNIEWTESTWNPTTGCTKISTGCKNCYAERFSYRLKAMGNPNYANGFEITTHEHALIIPTKWKKPRNVFVNSMSDLFHEDLPVEFIHKVFDVMLNTDRHQYQILTKRSKRLAELSPALPWPKNVWMGVSVENDDYTFRIEHLKSCGAAIKFLSLEPLLGPIENIGLDGIDWVIVGGESGPGARPIDELWVRTIKDECVATGTPFFFKQWGGKNKKRSGRILGGRTYDEMPAPLCPNSPA